VRTIFLVTLGLFLAGSVLCGLATSMGELIVFRAVQGLGGGGLMSVTMIAIGHLVIESGEKRGASAFAGLLVGMGLVVGPLLGGLLVDHASWRWVFFVNLPLGGLAWLLVARNLHLPHTTTVARLDGLGATFLSAAAACLLLVCEWGGQRYAWGSPTILLLALGGIAGAAAFAWRQTTAPEPFFPPRLLRHRTLRVITALQLVAGIGLASSIVYVTLAIQLIHHASPTGTGLRLIPLAVGLAVGATIGARILRRGGSVRLAIAVGQALAGAALLLLAGLGVEASFAAFSAGLVAFGAGLGLGLGNELLLVQTSVERTDLGMATAGMRFIETIGAAVGASAFGILFSSMTRHTHTVHAVGTAIGWIFALGGVMLLVASQVALRLPDVRYPAAGPGVPSAGDDAAASGTGHQRDRPGRHVRADPRRRRNRKTHAQVEVDRPRAR
ncbi:MAG: MFS transporter, partial [Solirubrobacteraceae bacterium]|nr:MFS transporter [Patulibacter sp.]